jgi:hypothetical protein
MLIDLHLEFALLNFSPDADCEQRSLLKPQSGVSKGMSSEKPHLTDLTMFTV